MPTEQAVTSVKCNQERHAGKSYFCQSETCEARICDKCFYSSDHAQQKYCMLCKMSIDNRNTPLKASDLDDFAKENKNQTNNFTRRGVRRDMKTGAVNGWKDFYERVVAQKGNRT